MKTLAQLTGAHRRTYLKFSQQPNLTRAVVKRTAVRSLLEALGGVTELKENSLEITRNGHVLTLPSLGTKKTEPVAELIALRHFLKRSENPPNPSNGRDAHLLLVIGHHEARLFRSEINGGRTEQLLPEESHASFPTSPSSRRKASADTKSIDQDSFFEPIARALQTTGTILIFGESSATQSEMDNFIAWLKREHPQQAERIIGSVVIEKDQATTDTLLTESREFYACTHTTKHDA